MLLPWHSLVHSANPCVFFLEQADTNHLVIFRDCSHLACFCLSPELCVTMITGWPCLFWPVGNERWAVLAFFLNSSVGVLFVSCHNSAKPAVRFPVLSKLARSMWLHFNDAMISIFPVPTFWTWPQGCRI